MFSRGRYSAAFVEITVKRAVRHSPKSKAVVAAEALLLPPPPSSSALTVLINEYRSEVRASIKGSAL
eukprot:scaffold36211_cov289-Skeletonema_dohrnii-CCMP3373.AAC.1